ncbi:MAG: 1-phosphofructokinase family hexose kinase [Cytophagales bacterium]|nr:MAG: 1-phosphofructokinase family hexose kinase [Cytophagales bacterium]
MPHNIFTLTLNPALDKSTTVNRVLAEHKMRCETPKYEPGGGGINVARAINKIGGLCTAVYTKGGQSGELLTSLLDNEKIVQKTILTQSHTRENFIVVEKSTNNQFRFGMPGQVISPSEVEDILNLLKDDKNNYKYLVVSGSTPSGIKNDFYYEVSSIAKSKNAKLILDTSGEALKEALKVGIYFFKPNLAELGELLGASDEDLDTIEEQEQAAKQLLSTHKIELLAVSLGAFGAVAATKDEVRHIPAPSVKKQSTVGAGDCMVAGIVLSLSKGENIFNAVKYGVACGTAATMNPGTELCKKSDVERLYRLIQERTL